MGHSGHTPPPLAAWLFEALRGDAGEASGWRQFAMAPATGKSRKGQRGRPGKVEAGCREVKWPKLCSEVNLEEALASRYQTSTSFSASHEHGEENLESDRVQCMEGCCSKQGTMEGS